MYFVVIIVLVAYVMVNLFMAVLKLKFAAASRDILVNNDKEEVSPEEGQVRHSVTCSGNIYPVDLLVSY